MRLGLWVPRHCCPSPPPPPLPLLAEGVRVPSSSDMGLNWEPTPGDTLEWETTWLMQYGFDALSSTRRLYVIFSPQPRTMHPLSWLGV